MRRLFITPSLLFGIIFAGGGIFIFSESALPMWQSWQQMQDWRPVQAQLLSFSGATNQTRANYDYEFAGRRYRASRVGVSEFKDNIGSYHRDMRSYLARIQRSNEPLPIWVNPRHPAQAVIDRNMRWGLFALVSGFCSIFVLVGLVVACVSLRGLKQNTARARPSIWQLRKRWQQEKNAGRTDLGLVDFYQQQQATRDDPESATTDTGRAMPSGWQSRQGWEDAQIQSGASRSAVFFWTFAIIWNAVSTPILFMLPRELARDNYLVLIGLLFPLVGLFLIYQAIRRTLEYRRFGKVLFSMDPYPGAIGGHVGGRIQVKNLDYRNANEAQTLTVTLECVYSYNSGSGKNRSRRESIKWAERGRPKIDNAIEGVNLTFRFDVPQQLPAADIEQSGDFHFWRLSVNADVVGIDLNRNYDIPVFATGATSTGVSHDISAQATSVRQQEADAAGLAIASGRFDIDGLSRAMRVHHTGNRIQLKFPMFRNKFLSLITAIFAAGFGFASYSMVASIGAGIWGIFIAIFALPFFLVALLAGLATIYLPFNNLSVRIDPGEVSVLRRLLLIPIYHSRLQSNDIAHLGIKRSGSTGQGVNKIEHFKIHAHAKQGRKLTLAEDIDGEDVARHLQDYLAQRIGVATK